MIVPLFIIVSVIIIYSACALVFNTEYLFLASEGEVMLNLTKPVVISEIKANITSYFGRDSNITIHDLFEWENHYLKYDDSSIKNRSKDPRIMLESGKGKCGEFSVLFASACIATEQRVRMLIVVNNSNFFDTPHALNEIMQDGCWVHVDASARAPDYLVVNNTSIYEGEGWDWWPLVGEEYKIFAFDEKGVSEDVTMKYSILS